ncbi:GntR family transcriptional regulator [Pacificibacter marinus]|nr:GntR family transcriptional regulator [Pacificibacter marinus]
MDADTFDFMRKNIELNIPEIGKDGFATTQEYVYERLKSAVMLGAIQPGTSLTMRGLAVELGLSPTPIRDALRRLSSESAVEILGNRRMIIPTMLSQRFEELVALRTTLEVHAARRAMPYISEVLINELIKIDDEMDRQIELQNHDHLTLLNQQFHRTLYTANPNQTVMPAINSVWLQLGPFQRQVIEKVEKYYIIDRHKEIIAALKIRDIEMLSSAVERDVFDGITHSGRELLKAQNAA